MNKIIKLKGRVKITGILKKSQARYAKGIKVGDEVSFVLDMVRTVGAANGNYVLYAYMYVNDTRFQCRISQNEFSKFAEIFNFVQM